MAAPSDTDGESTPLIRISGTQKGSDGIGNLRRNLETYKGQKTIHGTVQNTALFTANAAQFAGLLKETGGDVTAMSNTQVARLAILGVSLLFQLVVYMLLLLQGKTYVKKEEEYERPEQRGEEKQQLRKKNKVAIVFSALVVALNFALTQLN